MFNNAELSLEATTSYKRQVLYGTNYLGTASKESVRPIEEQVGHAGRSKDSIADAVRHL